MDMWLVFLLGLLPDHKNKNDGLKACLDGAAGTGPRFTNFACRAATDSLKQWTPCSMRGAAPSCQILWPCGANQLAILR